MYLKKKKKPYIEHLSYMSQVFFTKKADELVFYLTKYER